MKYYELLDVPPTASPEDIKAAYRIQVQLHHPDRLQQASPQVRTYAEDKLKRINEAYTVLSDPVRRAAYDSRFVHAARRTADDDDDDLMTHAARPGRKRPSRRQAEAEAASQWWRDQQQREADEQAYARAEAQRQRAQQQAEAERRAEQERARRAADRFPKVRREADAVILTFKPGLWTTLKRVPEGEFVMGSDPRLDPQANAHEQPAHRVFLPDYFIGQFPVTNAQFAVFAHDTRLEWAAPPHADDVPVTQVMWDEALAFCRWLSRLTGQPVRLPTEAEWEKAARGPEGRLYPWGETWQAGLANVADILPGPSPVGQFSPAGDSPYGVGDLAGNVWEWCADWYAPKTYAGRARWVAHNPHGPDHGEGYVLRGGAFDSPHKHARAAHRNWDYGFKRRKNVGFRLALTWVNG